MEASQDVCSLICVDFCLKNIGEWTDFFCTVVDAL